MDPKQHVGIFDMPLGYDNQIGLDLRYNANNPRVVTLDWSLWESLPIEERKWGNLRWKEVSPSLYEFLKMLCTSSYELKPNLR